MLLKNVSIYQNTSVNNVTGGALLAAHAQSQSYQPFVGNNNMGLSKQQEATASATKLAVLGHLLRPSMGDDADFLALEVEAAAALAR
jgi:hypothetical protein